MTKVHLVPATPRRAIAALIGTIALAVALLVGFGATDATASGSSTECLTDPLGQATGYTEFVRTNGKRTAESEGSIAYGGNLDAQWMTVGTHLNVGPSYPTVVVDGNANSFNIQKGSAWLPNRSGNSNFNGGGTYLDSAPIDFGAAFTQLEALSAQLAAQAANGSTAVVNTSLSPNPAGISLGGNALYLKGTSTGANVFTVNPSQLTGIVAILVEVPTGATAIVNVSGTNVQFNGQMYFRSGIGGSWNQAQDNATATQNARTLWNLPDATSVGLNTGSAFGGTILATKSHVDAFNVGHNIGQVIANSFESQRETHHAPFVGCLPGGDTPAPPKKPQLKIKKEAHDLSVTPPATGDPIVVKVGSEVGFGLSVWNHGDGPAENTVVTDDVPAGLTITYADPACTVTGQLVTCDAGTLAAGEGAYFWIKATTTLPTTPVANENEQLTIGKVERHVTLQAGETRTETINCDAHGIMSDAAVRVDHIDQDTGDYGDTEVHRIRSVSKGTYEAKVTNHATGQAQIKLFGVCLPGKTSAGHQLVVGDPVTETVKLNAGVHTLNLTCPAGTTPIAPGIEVSGGRALVLASAPNGATGRTVTVKVDGSGVQLTASMRCLDNSTSAPGGPGSELIFTQVAKPITVAPGQAGTESLICGDNAKGIVAGWEFDDGLVPLGNDPQPKSRVFKVWNPTWHPLNGTLYLLCLEARTGNPQPVDEKTYVNTATVSTSSEQEPGGQSSDSASVKVKRHLGTVQSAKVPTIQGAQVKGRLLLVRVKSHGRAGRVIARSATATRVGQKKVRRGTVVGKGRYRAGSKTAVARVRLGKAARKAIRSGKLKRLRVTVRSAGRSKTKVIRVRR